MNSIPRLLITGFEPFGGSPVNPSQRVVERLVAAPPKHVELVARVLPVAGVVAARGLVAMIRRERPGAVLLLGESSQASAITIEVVAVNLRDYRIPDNRGRVAQERPVVRGGPAAYFSTLPRKRLRSTLHEAGIPAEFSMSAGTYLCNEVMYAALHALREREAPHRRSPDRQVPCGFVHLPRLPEQVVGQRGAPSMDLELTVRGVRTLIDVIARA